MFVRIIDSFLLNVIATLYKGGEYDKNKKDNECLINRNGYD